MAINHVQMQPGLSIVEFMQHYGTQAQCEQALVKARCPTISLSSHVTRQILKQPVPG